MPVREAVTDRDDGTGRGFVFGQPGVSNHWPPLEAAFLWVAYSRKKST
jgi:hypothetical protein